MRHVKWFLSMTVTVVMLAVMSVTLTYAQGLNTHAMHPFNGTDELIKDAVEQLHEQGETMKEKRPDSKLVNKVEQASEMTFEEVKTEIVERLQTGLNKGEIDVSDMNLNKNVLQDVLGEVLYDNYLYNAITDMDFTTRGGRVTRIGFSASEGYRTAMDTFSDEYDALKGDEHFPLLGKFLKVDLKPGWIPGLRPDAAGQPVCQNHTVGAARLLGDVDMSGVLDESDVRGIVGLIAEEQFDQNADVNKDGHIDVRDIRALRKMIADGTSEQLQAGKVDFTWKLKYDMTPKFRTNENGQFLDDQGQVTQDPMKAILNGGLVYDAQHKQIVEGIMPEVYWELDKVSFRCARCGELVELTRENNAQQLDAMLTRYNIYVDPAVYNPQSPTGEGMLQVPVNGPQPSDPKYMKATEISVAQFIDDTFRVDEQGQPVVGPNGMPVGMYIDTNQNNNDNGVAQMQYYYSMLSAFNADHADYYGVSGDYWTSMNSEANPMAAIKSLCNMDPNADIPPAIMGQLVQMLPQAFMAYVHFYGNELLAMRDEAMKVVDALPGNATRVQKLLVLHDWLAENSIFDMGAMVNVSASGGAPETDPIQMTPFGAMLSNQLTEISQKGYYGCICLGYASAYTYLIQNAFPEIYKDSDGSWLTPAQLKGKSIVDFGQVMFYANTDETSIAGEGFGGGFFNNVHYYNMVRVDDAPTSTKKDDRMEGNWFFVDSCYDDIYVECLTQLRGEADGSVHHDFFLVSPQTMGKIWGGSIDYISHLYDGYVYKVKTDRHGNPVPYPQDSPRYNKLDPNHPQFEKVKVKNELFNDNTCFEDTWFSGAVSKVFNDGTNWYYVDAEATSSAFADRVNDQGEFELNMQQMEDNGIHFKDAVHANRIDINKQNKLKSRPMSAPDYWVVKEEDQDSSTIMGQKEESYKKDPYAAVIFDYGTGVFTKNTQFDLSEIVREDFVYNEQYPGLTHCLGMYDGKLYINLSNKIYSYDVATNECALVKEYHSVAANSDGRAFVASSFTMDPNGTALRADEGPIAGLLIHTAYRPLYNYVDAEGNVVIKYDGTLAEGYGSMEEAQAAIANRQFVMMYGAPTMTVNIASNLSFTAAFEPGMTDQEKSDSRYTKEGVNYNPDYSKWVEKEITDPKQQDHNDNSEFLWCANIREDVPMAAFQPSVGGERVIPCAGQETGHEYVYDAKEGVYICQKCHLHAKVVAAEDPNFVITMEHRPANGLGDKGPDKNDPYAHPINPAREAAMAKEGKILVTVKPAEGGDKIPSGITYTSANAFDTLESTTAEDGKYVLTKTLEKPCLEVGVLSEQAYGITINAKNGTVIAEPKVALPGETVKLTLKPDRGCVLKSLRVKDADGITVDLNKKDNTFVMPEAAVTVTAVFARAYTIYIDENIGNGSVTVDNSKASAGDEVFLTVQAAPGYELSILKVTNMDTQENVPVNMTYTSFIMPESDVEVTARFRHADGPAPTAYTVTVNNGSCDRPNGQYHEGEIVQITAHVGSGQKFNGWVTTNSAVKLSNASAATTSFVMPGSDVLVQANVQNVYTVTYKDNAGGAVFADQTFSGLVSGSPTPAFIVPDRPGYTFAGWTPEKSATVTGNAVYTATWTPVAEPEPPAAG